MTTSQYGQMIIVISLLMLTGCAEVTTPVSQKIHSRSAAFSLPQRIEDLAGPWEYKDDAGQGTINLNEFGEGAYDWKEGRFETLSLNDGHWTGIWVQEGNDREGGFELRFSNDAPVAQGEWWYTRIGNNHDPHQPGGTFRMARPGAILTGQ